ncbi:MAG: type II toxin-antitoxin system RelE/ParE family toxin [Reichenbachiella sp.]|uniref:type II toxin-antitoxin system RelE/ParE family toxin n=1 Tax=Reichenbachiella sp. TaxID=2184521 RepID=UPI003264D27E
MELTVYWTRFAEDKLADIFSYYKSQASTGVAQRMVGGIVDATIKLEKHPKLGRREDLLVNRKEEFRYLVYKNYRIIYWINEEFERVEIANVFDCRQNPTKME